MLNYADTTNTSTIVPLLSALLAHPDFAEGVRMANEWFFDHYDEEAPLSEEDMIEQVETNLSRRVTERGKQIDRVMGWESLSYLHHLGYVLGTIDKGLSYAR
jgi:hypothetical protein